MATKKEKLQAEAAELGLDFEEKTTIAQLEEMISDAENQGPARAGVDFTDADALCKVCNKPADHIHAGEASRQRAV